jgi:hypothetical protein
MIRSALTLVASAPMIMVRESANRDSTKLRRTLAGMDSVASAGGRLNIGYGVGAV